MTETGTPVPLCDEEEFAELVAEMVTDDAPRRFAIVREYGERVDAIIAAWGLAFDDRVHVVSTSGGSILSLSTPERALRIFRRGGRWNTRLVWADPEAPAEDDLQLS